MAAKSPLKSHNPEVGPVMSNFKNPAFKTCFLFGWALLVLASYYAFNFEYYALKFGVFLNYLF